MGQIDAEKLVRTAAKVGLLPAEMVNNQRYLNAVRGQLESQLPIY
jgi:hypothetical protein